MKSIPLVPPPRTVQIATLPVFAPLSLRYSDALHSEGGERAPMTTAQARCTFKFMIPTGTFARCEATPEAGHEMCEEHEQEMARTVAETRARQELNLNLLAGKVTADVLPLRFGERSVVVARYDRSMSPVEVGEAQRALEGACRSLGVSWVFFPQTVEVGITEGPGGGPWCIVRFAVDAETRAPAPFRPEVMRDLLCADIEPHCLCGPLSYRPPDSRFASDPLFAGGLCFPEGRITNAVARFWNREEAEAAIAAMKFRPACALDVAMRLADIHFFVLQSDPRRGARSLVKLYDGGDYAGAVVVARIASAEAPHTKVRIEARPRTAPRDIAEDPPPEA